MPGSGAIRCGRSYFLKSTAPGFGSKHQIMKHKEEPGLIKNPLIPSGFVSLREKSKIEKIPFEELEKACKAHFFGANVPHNMRRQRAIPVRLCGKRSRFRDLVRHVSTIQKTINLARCRSGLYLLNTHRYKTARSRYVCA